MENIIYWIQTHQGLILLGLALAGWGGVVAYLRFSGQKWGLLALLVLGLLAGAWAVGGRLNPPPTQAQAPREGEQVKAKTPSPAGLREQAKAWLDAHLTPSLLPLACPGGAVGRPQIGQGQAPAGYGDDWTRAQAQRRASRGLTWWGQPIGTGIPPSAYPPECWARARSLAGGLVLLLSGLGLILVVALVRGRGRNRD